MSLEIVRWRDAWFDRDGENDDDDFILETVGWVTEGPLFLEVASETGPNGFKRAVTHIPNVIVLDRIPLSTKGSPLL